MSEPKQKFSASLAKDAVYQQGLRSFMEYRDLGIADATHGKMRAHIVRVKQGGDTHDLHTTGLHKHECDFQMFYVLKGTIKFVYEGQGERTFGPGDCVLQPAGIVHNELECTDDLEILEIYSPAVHPRWGGEDAGGRRGRPLALLPYLPPQGEVRGKGVRGGSARTDHSEARGQPCARPSPAPAACCSSRRSRTRAWSTSSPTRAPRRPASSPPSPRMVTTGWSSASTRGWWPRWPTATTASAARSAWSSRTSWAAPTSSPGQLFNAQVAGSSLLVIAGDWASELQDYRGLAPFPGLSQAESMRPITKEARCAYQVHTNPKAISVATIRALREATTPPTGPVYLSISAELLHTRRARGARSARARTTRSSGRGRRGAKTVEAIARRLGEAQCPVLMFGDDVWREGAQAEAVRLAEALEAPVFASRQIFPNFPTRHPLFCGNYPGVEGLRRRRPGSSRT